MNQIWRVNHGSELQTFWLLTVLYLKGGEATKTKEKEHRMFLLMIHHNSKCVITGVKHKSHLPEATVLKTYCSALSLVALSAREWGCRCIVAVVPRDQTSFFVCVYKKDFPLKIHMQKAFECYTFDSS